LVVALSSCLPHPGRMSKLPQDINIVQHRQTIAVSRQPTDSITIQYLGAGGLYLLNKGEGILIDPFFSNQKIGKLATSLLCDKPKVKASEQNVAYGLTAIEKETGALAPQVKAIFSAHSHYDHLLDVPAVFEKLGRQPRVYLNQSGYNTCYSVIDPGKMEALEAHAFNTATHTAPIEVPMTRGTVNVYPILADHNPHLKHVKAFDGDITERNTSFTNPYGKTNANDWLEGNTFAFVIDYVDANKNITLRLFIQSSSCHPCPSVAGSAQADDCLAYLKQLPKHAVDIALLGVASYEASPAYPAALLTALDPTAVVWIHWEDFFRNYTRPPKTVRATNVPAFFKKEVVVAVKNKAYLPWPRAVLKVKY
jgi:hypothetical protein